MTKTERRIRQLKAMHELMIFVGDEDIYEAWIYHMPDEPSESDFESIAEDDEIYIDVVKAFKRLAKDEDFVSFM